jgi:hypothetical protein
MYFCTRGFGHTSEQMVQSKLQKPFSKYIVGCMIPERLYSRKAGFNMFSALTAPGGDGMPAYITAVSRRIVYHVFGCRHRRGNCRSYAGYHETAFTLIDRVFRSRIRIVFFVIANS